MTQQAFEALLHATIEGPLDIDAAEVLRHVRDRLDDLTATRHPVGFIHVQLGVGLRLHLWTEDAPAWTDDLGVIHDHTWEAKSLVLAGTLTNTFLRAVHGGPYKMFEVTGDRRLIADNVGLETIEQRRVDAGSWYFLPRRVIHMTRVHMYPTATLVWMTPFGAGLPRLIARECTSISSTPRPPVPSEETREALERCLAAIGDVEAACHSHTRLPGSRLPRRSQPVGSPSPGVDVWLS